MSKRLRIILPSVMGVVSLPLAIWDVHNERVIESMGMAWDTGAPIWPYQTSDILLRLLNGPAYFVSMPIANALRLAAPNHYFLVFPAILTWWWFLGLSLDRGVVTTNPRWRWSVFTALVAFAALLLWGATSTSFDAFRWWFRYAKYSRDAITLLIMTRFLTPAAWCVSITFLVATAAKRVARCIKTGSSASEEYNSPSQ